MKKKFLNFQLHRSHFGLIALKLGLALLLSINAGCSDLKQKPGSSAGKQPEENVEQFPKIPELLGQDFFDVLTQLQRLDPSIKVQTVYSIDYDQADGLILASDIPAGSPVQPNMVIKMIVNKTKYGNPDRLRAISPILSAETTEEEVDKLFAEIFTADQANGGVAAGKLLLADDFFIRQLFLSGYLMYMLSHDVQGTTVPGDDLFVNLTKAERTKWGKLLGKRDKNGNYQFPAAWKYSAYLVRDFTDYFAAIYGKDRFLTSEWQQFCDATAIVSESGYLYI